MSLALTLADNGDGTCTATVSGSGGAAVTLSAASPDALSSWTPAGSITGDGAVALALGRGAWWVAAAAPGVLPALGLVLVTDATLDPQQQCLAAVAARVALVLPAGWAVQRGAFSADDTGTRYPCAFVSVNDGREDKSRAGLNALDEVGYPVAVVLADRVDALLDPAALPALSPVRYRVDRAFDQQHLPGVTASTNCKVEPGPVLQRENDGRYLYATSGLTVRCFVRVRRGLSA